MTPNNLGNCPFIEDKIRSRGLDLQLEDYEDFFEGGCLFFVFFGHTEHEMPLRYSKANVKYSNEIMLLNLKRKEIQARETLGDKNNH